MNPRIANRIALLKIFRLCAAVGAPLAIVLAPPQGSPLAAQESTSREVVQPLPSAQLQRLNRALMELARSPRRVSAMIEAAEASLGIGDLDAAIGFYGRAADIEPNNTAVKLGLARVYLRSGNPTQAIPLINAALSAGAPARDLLTDQALAFDLIGDQASAQAAYSRALQLSPGDDEARRRYAISQAISGDGRGFEQTLAPLLAARDPAAMRVQAFGLAILGEQDRAASIVNATMPTDLAARITPYLAYMPRLTKSQQAAAANLGIFPRAADIGREDPRIARFAREGAVGSRLEPAGVPLGQQSGVQNAPQSAAESAPTATREPATAAPSVADAFADLGNATTPAPAAANGAVDISAIDIPRETAPQPEASQPAQPAHPSRIWVQLATGRDVSALRFDWRRFVRSAPELLGDFTPHVTPWGQSNRLLAGPVSSRSAARDLINALKEKGLDSFGYTSPEGMEIQELK